jgi:flavin-dependent dehydrogenase
LRRHRGDLDRLADAVFAVNPVLHDLWHAGQPSGEWKTIADVRVQASTPTFPGIFYIGDARGTIDPLGGQGMTMALLGAEMLAPFVSRALSEKGANSSLQHAYAAAWQRRFDLRIALCRAFHHVLVNAWFIDAASAFSTLAPRLLALGFNRTRDSAPPAD